MNELAFSELNNHLKYLKEALIQLKTSEHPLVIRSGLDFFSIMDWHNFLRVIMKFKEDRRHFNLENQIETANWWEISYQPEFATSYAYSNTRQPLHNDNAWFNDPAEINFFAMQKQSQSGGEQTIYPVSRLIDDLSSKEPSLLHDLLTQKVTIQKGNGSHKNITTILTNEDTPRCYWNFYRIDKSSVSIERMCNHFFNFLERQESTNSVYRINCKSGDCMAFNDSLLLHGRTSFKASKAYDRVLFQSMWNITS